MKTLILALLLLFIPAVQGCSIAYQEFSQADLGGDLVVTNLGQDAVSIDLRDGRQRTLDEGYFPRLLADDSGTWVYIAGQEGLGADCSGEEYLKIRKGTQVQTAAGVEAFDVDGKAAFIRGNTVTVAALGSKTGQTFTIPAAAPDGFVTPERRIALDATRVAISIGDKVHVYDHAGNAQWRLDVGGPAQLDWHDGRLVAAVSEGTKTQFWLATQDGHQTLALVSDDYAWPQIAAGAELYLKHGDQVLWVDGDNTRRLVVPSNVHIGAIAADDDRAVLLVVDDADGWAGDAKGIQVIDGGFGKWYRPAAGAWLAGNGPAWSWAAGPVLHGGNSPEAGQDSPSILPLLPLGVAALLRRRR